MAVVKKLLFFCNLSAGHFNVPVSLAKTILRLYGDRYEMWFLVNEEFKRMIEKKVEKAKFLIYSPENEEESKQQTIEFFSAFGEKWAETDRVAFVLNGGHTYRGLYEDCMRIYPRVTELIKQLKPDLILIDTIITFPTGINLGIPYVCILSAAPTYMGRDFNSMNLILKLSNFPNDLKKFKSNQVGTNCLLLGWVN